MLLTRKHIGQINLPNGTVDVTDPCYDRDVWCRTTIDIAPGIYNCYAYEGTEKGWGNRVWINQIVAADLELAAVAEEKIAGNRSWISVGEIGVDAGMAGFFDSKPDFDDEQWYALCESMRETKVKIHNPSCWAKSPYNKTNPLNSWKNDGFWTDSGIGDGGYPVYAIKHKGQIIALETRFL